MNRLLVQIIACVVVVGSASVQVLCGGKDPAISKMISEIDETMSQRPENKKLLNEVKKWVSQEGGKATVQDRYRDLIEICKMDESELCSREGHSVISASADHLKSLPSGVARQMKEFVKKYNEACQAFMEENYEDAVESLNPAWKKKVEIFVDTVNLREGLMLKSKGWKLSSAYSTRRMESALRRKWAYEKVDCACKAYRREMKYVFEPGFPLEIGDAGNLGGELGQAKLYYEACKVFLDGEASLMVS